jgi:transcription elongation factor GreA
MMKHVSLIKKGDGGVEARIGSTLTVEKDGAEKTFTIVGSEESKPEENKISNESPLGAAFLGKKVGDSAVVSTPNGQATYKITRVE